MTKCKAIAGLCFILAGMSASAAMAADRDEPSLHPTLPIFERDAADACRADAQQIRIRLVNIYAKGIAKFDLYGGEDGFLKSKGKMRRVRVPAGEPGQMVCIDVPEPGAYAVGSYHDLDANRKMKMKMFRPGEPFALSNNVVFKELRMPKWSEAAIEVGERGVDIELLYQGKKAGEVGDEAFDTAMGD